jgi:subtilisin family serine protease
MSFGFEDVQWPIFKQIKQALKRDKLVFAAASNDGGNSGRAFPARQSGVICIHSTDKHGNRSLLNPSPVEELDNFSILGQHIESTWPDENVAGQKKRMTGTSFATPVAVALAAFLIAYVQQEIPDLNTAIEIKSYEGITNIFRLLRKTNSRRDGYDLITPFPFFRLSHSKICEDLKLALSP